MTLKKILLSTFVLVLLAASVALAGCGGSSDGNTTGSDASGGGGQTGSAATYGLGQPVAFGGATFVFTRVEELESIPVLFEDEERTPDNGTYVVVYFDFQGEAGNETAGVDSAIFRLVDASGNAYSMNTDLVNYEVSDLAHAEGLTVPTMLLWNNTEEKGSLLVFDVESGANGLELEMLQSTGDGVKVAASVDLGM